MNSTTNLTVALIMIGVFTIAIIGFAIGFANDNNAAVSVADDADLMDVNTNVKANLDQYQSDTEDTYSSIVDTTVEPGSDVLRSPGSFTITWANAFSTAKNMITLGFRTIFGSGSNFNFFLFSFFSTILFLAALYVIKTWRGNP